MSRRDLTILGVLAVLMLAAWFGLQQLGAAQIQKANEAANDERWGEALDALEVSNGLPPSVTALYNEGVVRYRQGDVPGAIAHWRVARRGAPRDGDLQHNLAVARSELEKTPSPALAPLTWFDVVTPSEVGVLAILMWGLSALSFFRYRRRERENGSAVALTYAAAIVLSAVALHGRSVMQQQPIAVTIEEAIARDGAELTAGERFSVPAGTELLGQARRGPFVLVEDGEGRRGWMLSEALSMPEVGSAW